ncbi:DUF3251 domain-containing protein [Dickeya lacustris]|uniref:DUF3251 domain-containing protein n=1 Tax=Dickeya lacustris TaxID=2259638 RepID=A0ABY8G5S7_9GAMM|nr:DUF3251 domain-containing protein [Dickeya lacustris]WFN55302.1 DUF3251 domain-containing protein [Dickeya lacustris]
MIFHRRLIPILAALIVVTGCTKPPTNRVQSELGQINQQLHTLADRAIALEQQNSLNASSTAGVYLLPAAQNRALLDSHIGHLSISLSKVEAEANGARALLTIRAMDAQALPAFQAMLDWGPLDPVSGKPLTGDTQTQTLVFPLAQPPASQLTVEVRLANLTPEQLGFIRFHTVRAMSER